MVQITDLPQDLLLDIFACVGQTECIAALPLVCRTWEEALAKPSHVWSDLTITACAAGPLSGPGLEGHDPQLGLWPAQRLQSLCRWLLRRCPALPQQWTLDLTGLRWAGCDAGVQGAWEVALGVVLAVMGQSLQRCRCSFMPKMKVTQTAASSLLEQGMPAAPQPAPLRLQTLLANLPLCTRLATLDISHAHLAVEVNFTALCSLTALETLCWECSSSDAPWDTPLAVRRAARQDLWDAVCALHALTSLDITLRGPAEVPDAISKLAQLRTLRLQDAYDLQLPASCARLANLHQLHFRGCCFRSELAGEGPWCPAVSGLTALTSLEFDCCGRDLVPNNLCSLPALAVLSVHLDSDHTGIWQENPLAMHLPASFSQLSSLRQVSISNQGLTSLPPPITTLSSLEYLDVSRNSFAAVPSEGLAALRSLKVLHMIDQACDFVLSAEGGSLFCHSTALERACLGSDADHITVAQPSFLHVASLPKLQYLWVASPQDAGSKHVLSELRGLLEADGRGRALRG